jgi:hypothetical protein
MTCAFPCSSVYLERLLRIICGLTLALAALLLTGCGVVKIGYNNAASLTYWWLDSYLDFEDSQDPTVRAGLDALLAWHRKSELPAYAATLRKVQQLSSSNVSPEQVCAINYEVRAHVQRSAEQTERLIGELIAGMKPEQYAHMARKFEKNNVKWRQEWLEGSAEERAKKRLTKAVERGEMIYGRLEPAQMAALRQSIATSSFDARLSYKEVLRRQQDSLQSLKDLTAAGAANPNLKTEILAMIDRNLNSPDPVYRPYFEKMLQESCVTLANLHNSASPKQRERALKKLQEYEADVKALAAAG